MFLNVQLSQGSPAVWRMKASQAECGKSVSRSGGERDGVYNCASSSSSLQTWQVAGPAVLGGGMTGGM